MPLPSRAVRLAAWLTRHLPSSMYPLVYLIIGFGHVYIDVKRHVRPRQVWQLVQQYGQQIKFAAVGVTVYLTGVGLLYWFIEKSSWPYLPSISAKTVISVEMSFFLSRYFTWRRYRKLISFQRSWRLFHTWRVLSGALSVVLFNAQTHVGIGYQLANAACVIVSMGINYTGNNEYTFRPPPQPLERPVLPDNLPYVFAIIPCRNNNVFRTVNELYRQVEAAFVDLGARIHLRVIIAGSPGDVAYTEASIPEWLRVPRDGWMAGVLGTSEADPFVWMAPGVVKTPRGGPRDAQLKRYVGQLVASYMLSRNARATDINRSILLAMDSDVLPLPSWLERTLYAFTVEGYECAAGPLQGDAKTFSDIYIDKTTQAKTPRMPERTEITAAMLGKWKPPVTANLAFTYRLWWMSGGSRAVVQRSYEDYSLIAAFFEAVPNLRILIDPALGVAREHLTGIGKIKAETRRSGTGCHEFLQEYQTSLFAILRWLQLAAIPPIGVVMAVALLIWPQTTLVLLVAGLLSQMAANVMISRKAYAVAFPFINLMMSYEFITGVCERYTLRGFRGYPVMSKALMEEGRVRNTPVTIDDLFPRGGES